MIGETSQWSESDWVPRGCILCCFVFFRVWFYALSVSTSRGYAFRRSVVLDVCVGGRTLN